MDKMFIIKSYKGYWCNGAGWVDDIKFATKFKEKDKMLEDKIRAFFPTVKLSHIKI